MCPKIQPSSLVLLTICSGDPHPTPSKEDPLHGSVLFKGANGGNVVSAHVYPSGLVKFSTKKYSEVNVGRDSEAPADE